jgi:hypothetical protein
MGGWRMTCPARGCRGPESWVPPGRAVPRSSSVEVARGRGRWWPSSCFAARLTVAGSDRQRPVPGRAILDGRGVRARGLDPAPRTVSLRNVSYRGKRERPSEVGFAILARRRWQCPTRLGSVLVAVCECRPGRAAVAAAGARSRPHGCGARIVVHAAVRRAERLVGPVMFRALVPFWRCGRSRRSSCPSCVRSSRPSISPRTLERHVTSRCDQDAQSSVCERAPAVDLAVVVPRCVPGRRHGAPVVRRRSRTAGTRWVKGPVPASPRRHSPSVCSLYDVIAEGGGDIPESRGSRGPPRCVGGEGVPLAVGRRGKHLFARWPSLARRALVDGLTTPLVFEPSGDQPRTWCGTHEAQSH